MRRLTPLTAIALLVLLLSGCVQVTVLPALPKLPWQQDPGGQGAGTTAPAPYDDSSVVTPEPLPTTPATGTHGPPVTQAPTTFVPQTTRPIPPTTRTVPTTSVNPADCRTDEVSVTFVTDPSASGRNYDAYLVWMRNVSTRSCQLFGFPGVDFMSGPGGQQVGHEGFRDRIYTPTRISIDPGQRAAAEVRIADTASVAGCRPTSVPGVRIYVPNTYSPQFFAMPVQACSNPQAIQLTVRATRFVG